MTIQPQQSVSENEKVPEVVVYRLNAVELAVSNLDQKLSAKLDSFILAYASKEHLDLVVSPILQRVIDLEEDAKQAEIQRETEKNQVRMVWFAASINFIFAVTLLVLQLVQIPSGA